MSGLREAAQQALEFFDAEFGWSPGEAPRIDALRAALAQQAEPVQDSGYWGRVAARQARRIRQLETAAQQALEALDAGVPISPGSILHDWFRAALAQQAEPVEPVAWKQGNLVTFNEDPCPVLGGLFVQFWDGEEVAARVYANDHETLRQRCAKVNAAPPQRTMVLLTSDKDRPDQGATYVEGYGYVDTRAVRAVEKAVWEKNHGQA